MRLTERSHHEHKSWAPGRKTDRLGYTLESARAEVARHLEDDMTPEQEDFLNKLMATAEAQGTSAYFLAGLMPLYRKIPDALTAIRRRLDIAESQLADLRQGGSGDVPQDLRDEITEMKQELDRIQQGLAEAAGV